MDPPYPSRWTHLSGSREMGQREDPSKLNVCPKSICFLTRRGLPARLLARTRPHSDRRRAAAPSPPTCSSYWPGSPTWLARVSRRTRSSRLVAMKKRCLEAGSCSRRGSTQPLPSRTRRRRAVARPMVTGRTRTFRPKPFGRGAPSPPPEPAPATIQDLGVPER